MQPFDPSPSCWHALTLSEPLNLAGSCRAITEQPVPCQLGHRCLRKRGAIHTLDQSIFFPLLLLFLFFFFTLVTGTRRSLSLKLSDTRVYEPQIRARLGSHNTPILTACRYEVRVRSSRDGQWSDFSQAVACETLAAGAPRMKAPEVLCERSSFVVYWYQREPVHGRSCRWLEPVSLSEVMMI